MPGEYTTNKNIQIQTKYTKTYNNNYTYFLAFDWVSLSDVFYLLIVPSSCPPSSQRSMQQDILWFNEIELILAHIWIEIEKNSDASHCN